jgi:hypothetical protein
MVPDRRDGNPDPVHRGVTAVGLYTALAKKADADQPRKVAKSVTVE